MSLNISLLEISMLIAKETITTAASAANVWSVWEDVSNWNTWDNGIEFTTINGSFSSGAEGTLKPKGGPLVHMKFIKVEPMKAFVTESKLPLTKIIFSHFLSESNDCTEVTHKIEMIGCLAFIFSFLIGRGMKKNLPKDMKALALRAESLN